MSQSNHSSRMGCTTTQALQVILSKALCSQESFSNLNAKTQSMDLHTEQSNPRRRLNFDDIDMETPDSSPRNRRTEHPTLSRLPRAEQCSDVVSNEGTDTESPSGTPERHPATGYTVLHEGYNRPDHIRIPHRGMATVIVRDLDGFIYVVSLPRSNLHMAYLDDSETETERSSLGDENDD